MSMLLVRSVVRTRAVQASLLLGGMLAVGCSGAHEPAERTSESSHHGLVRPTVNVPALLGYSIEGLRQHLGTARELTGVLTDTTYFNELAPKAYDSLLVFRTGGLLLVASYDIRSRHVNDLFLLGHHEDSLMQRASLRADAPNYLVLPAFRSAQPGKLLGLRIIPVQQRL